jgi:retron-type reverse transcriptase
MDLRSSFDTIPHDVLMGLLKKKSEDKRFLRLIQAMLDAGSPSGLDGSHDL